MHGAGNDYVYVDCFKENIENRSELAMLVSDRHFGVGSDGLICICPSDKADVCMDMYNLDGSRGRMCGNGIRCVAKYAYEHGYASGEEMTIETLSGIKTVTLETENGIVKSVRVCMGTPVFRPSEIPVLDNEDDFILRPMDICGKRWLVTCVSVGNPHAVVFVDDIDSLNLEEIGPYFENNELFPDKINTEFAQIIDSETIKMRVWERGSGETLACGTGATATLCASAVCGRSGNRAKLCLLGGELIIEWDRQDNLLYMTGPAEYVFEGELLLGKGH